MESFLGTDETPPSSERSFKAATKLGRDLPTDIGMESIPLMELLTEDIHAKTQEAPQNIDLDMRVCLGIYKALQTIRGKLANSTSK